MRLTALLTSALQFVQIKCKKKLIVREENNVSIH